MANVEECRTAVDRISDRISRLDEAQRRAHIVERTISLTVSDLGTVFTMRLTPGGLTDVVDATLSSEKDRAQVRITLTSDDLVALADDRLDYAKALLTGRVKVKASLGDLARLRKLL
ncbi:SCP2 sterol-binding domain-containing protein [Thermobifida cellulosilytica]|uniref:SCP-2 sterol transfer family protein n=1 Tax=Thermobifida cellulosilytica TB100 TaxID=665004 RepID=A0A147KDC4_THECS|nr:SCP2 sterol-binding domain-containing protein [Thermobifida cellulosilytica]KUP95260.1 SCP-2 sterol transfer family protein [Thermobifida cellulosilytica TB100]